MSEEFSSQDSILMELEVYKVTGNHIWPYFAKHHYLSKSFTGAHSFIAVNKDGQPVAMVGISALPSGTLKNAWRGHRTVVAPDYQGLGIGARLSEWVGEWVLRELGGRYYCKTSHPRLGEYRENSPYWRPTSKNKRLRYKSEADNHAVNKKWASDHKRLCYSHEYIGRNLQEEHNET